jgi:putative ABC transport system permease protein
MNRSRLIHHSIRAMSRYRLRSAFIILGGFVGAAALTLVIAVGDGARRKMLSTFRQLFGASSIIVVTGGSQLLSGPGANAARLTIDDIDAVAAEVPEIRIWDPQQVIPDAAVKQGSATATARVLGASERNGEVWGRSVTRGEMFDATAVKQSARVALIGETTAKQLFGTVDPIGGEILIRNVPFRVIGVLERFGTDLHGMDRDAEVVVPISTMMRRVMNVDTISMAKLLVQDASQVARAADEVKRVLRARHAIPSGRPNDFTIITAVFVQRMLGRMQNMFKIYLPLVAAVVLLVAAIVAATLMLASVNERTGEIGLRRAVGARMQDVQLQFLVETAATILTGGIGGIIVGSAIAQVVANRFHLGPVVSWRPVVIGVIVSIVTGLVAGVLPARRAARLNPIDALR